MPTGWKEAKTGSPASREKKGRTGKAEKLEKNASTATKGQLILMGFDDKQENILRQDFALMKKKLHFSCSEITSAYEERVFKTKSFRVFGVVWGLESDGRPKFPKYETSIRLVMGTLELMRREVEKGVILKYENGALGDALKKLGTEGACVKRGDDKISILDNFWEQRDRFAILGHELSHIVGVPSDYQLANPQMLPYDGHAYHQLFMDCP